MVNVREAALEYEGSTTKNVSELEVFDTQLDLKTFEGKDKDDKDYSYDYIEDDEKTRYRVPKTVLAQIKLHLEENPEQLLFKVKRTGTTKNDTKYTVVPVGKKSIETN